MNAFILGSWIVSTYFPCLLVDCKHYEACLLIPVSNVQKSLAQIRSSIIIYLGNFPARKMTSCIWKMYAFKNMISILLLHCVLRNILKHHACGLKSYTRTQSVDSAVEQ